jgi:uncharacterized Zn finger protein (UPF0148 family)
MSEAVVEQGVCSKCGAEVRDGTTFCYKCGGRVATQEEIFSKMNGPTAALEDESKAALDDLAQKLKSEPEGEPQAQLAKAAEERRKARVSQRKAREFVWEPRNDTPIGLFVSVGVVLVIAVLVVLVTVVWK